MSTKFSHGQKNYITELNAMDDALVAVQAQVDALDPGSVVITPPQDNTVYTTLAQSGTYATPAGVTCVHHIGDGVALDPNNPHNMATYVADMTTDTANQGTIPEQTGGWRSSSTVTQQGTRIDQVEQWYKDTYGESSLEWCHHGLSWYVAMEGTGHTATNTRLQVRNLRTLYLSDSTRKWVEFDMASRPSSEGWMYTFEPVGNDGDWRSETDANGGGISVKPSYTAGPSASTKLFNHGYGNGHYIPAPWDWRAIMVTMEFRLIKDNPAGVDDRANAVFLVNTGLDLRPGLQSNGTFYEWPSDFVPGVGTSKMYKGTNTWQGEALVVPNPWHGCTYAELLNNPPAFAINASPGTSSTTVTLPDNPVEGQVAKYVSVAQITTFNVNAASGETGAFTFTLPAETEVAFRYRASNSTWYRIR